MARTILFCREVPWRTSLQISTLRLAKQFASHGWRVIWLCPPLPPWHRVRRRGEELERQHAQRGLILEDGAVLAYTPFSIVPFSLRAPLGASTLADRQWGLCVPSIRSIIRRRGFAPPDVMWLSHYSALGLPRLFPDTPKVWHITDDYPERSSFPTRCRALCQENYDRADHLVFASPLVAQKVVQRYGLAKKPTTVLPHGVDDFQLAPAQSDDPLAPIGRPRVVYLGNTTQTEVEHFARVADESPAEVVVIGPKEPLGALENHPRVHLLGPRQPEQAAEILKHCDVGFINYSWTHLSFHGAGGNPMKTYEYAAAGLALLGPRMEILHAIGAPVVTYRNDDELTGAVRTVLEDRDRLGAEARAWASGQTWETRFEEAEELVLKLI